MDFVIRTTTTRDRLRVRYALIYCGGTLNESRTFRKLMKADVVISTLYDHEYDSELLADKARWELMKLIEAKGLNNYEY